MIAWISDSQDGSSRGVFAQRHNAAGEAVGPEFRVNTLVGGEQSYPQVAGLSDGGFVVTWQDSNGNEGSGWGWGVFGQRFGADGSPVGGQITINTTTSGTQYHSTLASYTDGYAVVWSSEGYMSGSDSYDIYLTRFDNAGNVVGTPEQRVSTAVGQRRPARLPGSPADRRPQQRRPAGGLAGQQRQRRQRLGRLRSRVSRRHRQLRRHLPGQQLHPSTQISPDVAAPSGRRLRRRLARRQRPGRLRLRHLRPALRRQRRGSGR